MGRGTERTYSGTSNLPSLDEVIQEGILGLSRAVDKYDSSLGYRFGTYATYWINSYVQAVFQKTSGGILPVPYNVSTLRSKYNKILKDYYDANGNSQPPDEKKVAKQLGISVKRLRTVLRATSGIISLDAPITTVDSKNDAISFELYNTISDDGESHPDTYAELALLRQRLEKAMASELSPYERDIVRLRLGLDDGQVKSIREIARMSGRSDISMNDIRSTEKKAYYVSFFQREIFTFVKVFLICQYLSNLMFYYSPSRNLGNRVLLYRMGFITTLIGQRFILDEEWFV